MIILVHRTTWIWFIDIFYILRDNLQIENINFDVLYDVFKKSDWEHIWHLQSFTSVSDRGCCYLYLHTTNIFIKQQLCTQLLRNWNFLDSCCYRLIITCPARHHIASLLCKQLLYIGYFTKIPFPHIVSNNL